MYCMQHVKHGGRKTDFVKQDMCFKISLQKDVQKSVEICTVFAPLHFYLLFIFYLRCRFSTVQFSFYVKPNHKLPQGTLHCKAYWKCQQSALWTSTRQWWEIGSHLLTERNLLQIQDQRLAASCLSWLEVRGKRRKKDSETWQNTNCGRREFWHAVSVYKDLESKKRWVGKTSSVHHGKSPSTQNLLSCSISKACFRVTWSWCATASD